MGPLHGIRIVEFQGIGPGPFCATLLSDLGAEVLRVDRITPSGLGLPSQPGFDPLARGRSSVLVDLKHPDGVAFALDLVAEADGVIEGFRPGVMERLGLGPDSHRAGGGFGGRGPRSAQSPDEPPDQPSGRASHPQRLTAGHAHH